MMQAKEMNDFDAERAARIDRLARKILGRPIRRSTAEIDAEAVDAIVAAARELGMMLWCPADRWAKARMTPTTLARAFVREYRAEHPRYSWGDVQSYRDARADRAEERRRAAGVWLGVK